MKAMSRFGIVLIWAALAASSAMPADGAVVSPPLLVAPPDADVQSVARAFHRATGFPLVVIHDGRHVPPGVSLDTPRRMRFLFWSRGEQPVWKPWRSLAAAVGEVGPSQLLIFGDTTLIPDRWLDGVPRRCPRVRFLGNDHAAAWLHHAQANAERLEMQRRETARRRAALAAQRTTSVLPSPEKTSPARLLALPPVWDMEPPAARPPETARVDPLPAVAEPDAMPAPDVAPPEEPVLPTPIEPEPVVDPAPEEEEEDEVAIEPPEPAAPESEAELPPADPPEEPAPPETPAVEPSPALPPESARPALSDDPERPRPGSAYDTLHERFAAASALLPGDTGNPALPRVRSHAERALDWARQLQLAREGNYPHTALAVRDRMQRELDQLRTALAEYREHLATTSARIAELKAEKLDFGAVDWPSAESEQARVAGELASLRAGRADIADLRADPDRYTAVRRGLALEEEIEQRVGAFETAARSFSR